MMLLERWGGALFRPMIAEFSPENLAHPESLDMFMWGSDVMVDFKVTDSKEDRILIFPKGSDWVSLISYDTFQGGHNITIRHNEYFDLGLYQKAGTIVA
jgi:alpha-glucosidase (family GH31 glycosyl hydrolase)